MALIKRLRPTQIVESPTSVEGVDETQHDWNVTAVRSDPDPSEHRYSPFHPSKITRPSAEELGFSFDREKDVEGEELDGSRWFRVHRNNETVWSNGHIFDLTEPNYPGHEAFEGQRFQTVPLDRRPNVAQMVDRVTTEEITPVFVGGQRDVVLLARQSGNLLGINKNYFRYLAQKYPTAQYVISPDWDADDAKTVLIHVKVNSQVVAGVMPVSGLDPALNYDQISKSLPVQPLPQPTQSRTLGANDPLDVSGGERPTRKRWVKGDPPRDHYQEVTDNILSAIESGTAPWQRSWDNVPRWPVNALTNKPYHGINVLMLVSQGFQDQRWCSYKSAKAETWQVRAKEQGTKIYFYKPLQRETGKLDHTGQPEVKTIPLLRSYTIFNLSQMDNAPDLDRTTTAERVLTDLTVQISEEIIEASGAEIVHGYRRAGYSPSEDKVYMPDRASFTSDAEYYSVVLHELAHWTGHETRMAREFGTSRESDEYAREELRAEMASAMIGMRLGLPAAIDGHAAYVEHYMEILRGDKKEVFRAARDAEKIARYVLSFHPEFRDEFEAEHQAQMTAAVSAGAPEDVFDASDFDFEPDFELDSLRP